MCAKASFQRVWESFRCSLYGHKNYQLLNVHIITPQIPTFKVPNRFQESYSVKCFKVIKHLKSIQKAEAYLQPKRESMMQLFYEYTERLTIFAIDA